MSGFPGIRKLVSSRRELVRLSLPVLALALVASVVTGRERPSEMPVEPVARIDTRIAPAIDADLDLSVLERPAKDQAQAAGADPFARPHFDDPRPAAHAEAAPQKAGPPPLPFTYLGKVIEDGRLQVFLGRGDDSYSVARGTKIGKEYRVDKVTESSVTFTYLPLKTKQVLDIPAVN